MIFIIHYWIYQTYFTSFHFYHHFILDPMRWSKKNWEVHQCDITNTIFFFENEAKQYYESSQQQQQYIDLYAIYLQSFPIKIYVSVCSCDNLCYEEHLVSVWGKVFKSSRLWKLNLIEELLQGHFFSVSVVLHCTWRTES